MTSLPWTLPISLVVSGVLFLAVAGIGGAWLLYALGDVGWEVAVAVVQLVSVVVTFFVLAGARLGAIRRVASMTADVIGFWPTASHPLAGASYRDDAVAEVRRLVRQAGGPVALVGHSQGSVIVAWALGDPRLPAKSRTLGLLLVTCGSPLRSLYATFFPAHFDACFFKRVERNAQKGVGQLVAQDRSDRYAATRGDLPSGRTLGRPSGGGRLRGHGDYWIEAKLTDRVRDHLADGRGPQSDK